MGKFKPAGRKRKNAPKRANAIGCIVVLLLLFVGMFFIIFYTVQGAK